MPFKRYNYIENNHPLFTYWSKLLLLLTRQTGSGTALEIFNAFFEKYPSWPEVLESDFPSYKYKIACLYLFPSFTHKPLNHLHQNLYRPSHQLRKGFLHKSDPGNPNPWPRDTSSNKTCTDHKRKTLLYKKCPDGWLNHIKSFTGSTGPWLASIIIITMLWKEVFFISRTYMAVRHFKETHRQTGNW